MHKFTVLAAALGMVVSLDARAEGIVILNSEEASYSIIAPSTRMEVQRLPIGREPHHLMMTPDGKDLLIASTGTNDTAHSVAMTRAAEEVGAAAVLVVTPYYNRPSVAGLRAHFSAVADATGLPVMLYDIPVRSGRRIGCDLTLELARSHGNILAIKDATGDVASAGRMVAEAPDGFEVYCGDDSLFLPFLAVGAEGLVGVATHWAGSRIGEMARAFGEGRVGDARRMNASLDASWRFESSDDYPNPVPTKAMMRVLGLPGGSCRLPHGPITAEIEDRARAVFAGLGAPASKNAIG